MIRSKLYPALVMAVFTAAPGFAQLSLSPEVIDLNDVRQSKNVLITFDGKAISKQEILRIVTGVTKTGDALPENASGKTHFSDYSYMFDFDVGDDGVITVVPKAGLVEVGKYDLVVFSVHGKAKGLINANLRDSLPPKKHQPLNLSAFSYDIKLPDYTYGRAISIELNPDSKNSYTWLIDGEVHSSGLGVTSFRAWPEPGDHEISYIALSPEGVELSRWSDRTVVAEEETIAASIRKGYKVPFSSPAGFSQVSWSLDGEQIAQNSLDGQDYDTRYLKFRGKGRHTLICIARNPETGNFRRVTWLIRVK